MKIEGFDWDSGNSMKNEEKHGISRHLIELFFQGRPWVGPDLRHSNTEDRLWHLLFERLRMVRN